VPWRILTGSQEVLVHFGCLRGVPIHQLLASRDVFFSFFVPTEMAGRISPAHSYGKSHGFLGKKTRTLNKWT